MFDPKPTKYPFPEYTDRHYLVVKKDNGLVFDEQYPYIDASRRMRIKQFWTRVLLRLIVFPLCRLRLGLKIHGREHIKKNRELLKNGVVSCANHVHLWDYIAVMRAVWPAQPFIPVWDRNVRGENGRMIRLVGGIPIPVGDHRAVGVFHKTILSHLQNGGWLHIYPEGSMWEYYAPIRPFKSGVGHFAEKADKPVLPMAFSYREPGWIRKKIFRQTALFTLCIGEPILPDHNLERHERAEDLVRRSHKAVCRLAGIDPAENPYPAIFNRTKKVEYAFQ